MIHIVDERDISPSHKFYNSLPDVDVEKDEQEVGLLYSIVRSVVLCNTAVREAHIIVYLLCPQDDSDFQPTLLRVSDETGSLETSIVAEGDLPRASLDPKDG